MTLRITGPAALLYAKVHGSLLLGPRGLLGVEEAQVLAMREPLHVYTEALRAEALAHNDHQMAQICAKALTGESSALRVVARCLAYTAAQS